MKEQPYSQGIPQQAVNLAILQRLQTIEDKLGKQVSHFTVEDAVSKFSAYRLSLLKRPRAYNYLLRLLQEDFKDRNIAAPIPATEIKQFLLRHWGNKHFNTLATQYILLKSFFNWCALYLESEGSPSFTNPCKFFQFKKTRHKAFESFPVETMKALLRAGSKTKAGNPSELRRLLLLVMATSGMRPGEACNLVKKDISGQLITIRDPKSRRYNEPEIYDETAVIPKSIADDLGMYLEGKKDDDRVFMRYNCLVDKDTGILPLLRNVVENFHMHDFRRWITTYWNRKGSEGSDMVNFILRHKANKETDDPSRKYYVATLSLPEACLKVNELKNLIGGN